MIAKTFTPEIGAKVFAIMVAAAARTGGGDDGVASVPNGELVAGGPRAERIACRAGDAYWAPQRRLLGGGACRAGDAC
jgi:hypothetical protein